MMLMLPTVAAFASLVAGAEAWTQLAAGNYLESGSISSTLRWQSSGFLASGGCTSSWGIKKCYSLKLGGVGTNLQSTTATDYNSKLKTLSAAPTTQEGWENLAAADDDNLEAYFNAFPAAYSSNFADVKLMARQVVQNCSSGGGNGTEPPPPPSPRQRIEFLSWPGAAAGQTWKYTWKTRYGTTSTGDNFNHIWQILRRDACGGASVTMDLRQGQVQIRDNVKPCGSNNICASTPVSNWFNKVVVHTMIIRYGIRGSINYSAVESGKPKVSLIKYSRLGDVGASASLKAGMYRASVTGVAPASVWIGDWTATRTN
ncbi:hypothetical protein BCR35DRAFT_326611 [Leucosporidium creatinivorum]|uniref:Uncharacterized protein n=1 Tax=Leucosporidium creatinivorum TaxID=106004 RepID=A0A1Y2DZ98_9BASI|nr:hypothetical protein BCR35DRAFT_326611 [Leucosporidium creatinivorum]